MTLIKRTNMVSRLLILLLSSLLLSACVNGEYFVNKGKQSYYAKRYRQAFISLKSGAEKDNPDAQYALGYMYFYGQGVTENKQKALFWFNRAALNGHQKAIQALNMLKTSMQKN